MPSTPSPIERLPPEIIEHILHFAIPSPSADDPSNAIRFAVFHALRRERPLQNLEPPLPLIPEAEVVPALQLTCYRWETLIVHPLEGHLRDLICEPPGQTLTPDVRAAQGVFAQRAQERQSSPGPPRATRRLQELEFISWHEYNHARSIMHEDQRIWMKARTLTVEHCLDFAKEHLQEH